MKCINYIQKFYKEYLLKCSLIKFKNKNENNKIFVFFLPFVIYGIISGIIIVMLAIKFNKVFLKY